MPRTKNVSSAWARVLAEGFGNGGGGGELKFECAEKGGGHE